MKNGKPLKQHAKTDIYTPSGSGKSVEQQLAEMNTHFASRIHKQGLEIRGRCRVITELTEAVSEQDNQIHHLALAIVALQRPWYAGIKKWATHIGLRND